VTILIRRIGQGPPLVFEDPAALAADFFANDASASPGGYDDHAGKGDPDRVTVDDIRVINQTMRARSALEAWKTLTDVLGPHDWLAALDPEWDLVETDDEDWERERIDDAILRALAATIGAGRRASVATKVLHLKRPRLFPVLDSLVLEQLGATGAVAELAVVRHLRTEGRRNRDALKLVQAELAPRTPSLVRILDALLWASHPGSGLSGALGAWAHVIRRATAEEAGPPRLAVSTPIRNRRANAPTVPSIPADLEIVAPVGDIVVLGCVSEKQPGPAPAKDLYTSPLFAKRRRYAEASGRPWVIFSAQHGVIRPDDIIEWYDVALKQLPQERRAAIGRQAAEQLERIVGPVAGKTIEIHAGEAYVSAIKGPLVALGARVVQPLQGLRFGYQLQWYDRQAVDGRPRAERPARRKLAPQQPPEISNVRKLGPYKYSWPKGVENFDRGWEFEAIYGATNYRIRHGVGEREVYGRHRVHTVTWVNGEPMVEGVAADDWESSQSLVSVIRADGRRHMRARENLPAGYETANVVEHHVEIAAPYSPRSVALKLRVDDLSGWAQHALIRRGQKRAQAQAGELASQRE